MNNYDLGKKLLAEVEEIIDDMARAYARKAWNLTVRRAQEVVELTLKGLLKIMGVEFPKVHNVGDIFSRICREKAIEIDSETLTRIDQISSELAEDRAPSFYFEKDYELEEAREAKENAEWIRNLAKDLVTRLA